MKRSRDFAESLRLVAGTPEARAALSKRIAELERERQRTAKRLAEAERASQRLIELTDGNQEPNE